MKKQTKIKIFKAFAAVIVVLAYQGFIASNLRLAAPLGASQAQAAAISGNNICTPNQADPTHNISNCINNVYILVIGLSSFVAVTMFVFAGYLYMFGEEENVTKAKHIFSSTIAGLIILFGTYAILNTINPDVTKINGVILPAVNCTGAVKCQIPSPATADSTLPQPVAGQCQDCVPLNTLGVPVANSAIIGNKKLGQELTQIKPANGVKWMVTSAFSPNHRSSCHTQTGTCADLVVTGGSTSDNWVALCNAVKAAGFTSTENEIGTQDQAVNNACGPDKSASEPFRTGANLHVNMF